MIMFKVIRVKRKSIKTTRRTQKMMGRSTTITHKFAASSTNIIFANLLNSIRLPKIIVRKTTKPLSKNLTSYVLSPLSKKNSQLSSSYRILILLSTFINSKMTYHHNRLNYNMALSSLTFFTKFPIQILFNALPWTGSFKN